jgi:EmrB/QacA subfamily drug resistance transporter
LLIAFRALQAVGGSMLNPVAMSIITNTFTEPRERAQAIGVWGAVVGISMALGPVIGGVLVTSVGWRSIFWINVPIGLVAAFLALRFVPESKAPHPRRPDVVGQLLVIALLASLTYGIIEAPEHGWGSAQIVAVFVIAAASLGGILAWEPKREQPLVDLRFFRSVPFAGATIIAVAAFAALGGFLFLNTLYLQEVRGLSALHAGLDTLPLAVMAMLCPPIAGRMVADRGARLPLLVAGVGIAASCLMLVHLEDTTPFTLLFIAYVIFGVGFGFVNAPITYAAVSGMPRAQAGVAAGIASTSRQIGQTLGVAIVGSMVSVSAMGPLRAGFTEASHAGWWTLAICGVIVLVMGMVATSRRALATAWRTAEELNPEALDPLGPPPSSRRR